MVVYGYQHHYSLVQKVLPRQVPRVVDPDPYWESGSRGKKIKKFQWKKCTF
jgi:hypothetical protein